MAIRETIARHSTASTIVVICVVVACIVVVGMELKGDNGQPPAENFFTIDDGQTWFPDSATKLPPFDHNGSKAVRCYIFKGKNGKFAGLLEKYSDDTLNQLAHRDPKVPIYDSPPTMVKKPGEKEWKSMGGDERAMILMHISGPDGSDVERVMP